MKELFIFLLVMFGIVIALCLIWYWAMKKYKATLFLLVSLFAIVNIGVGVFFWLGTNIDIIIILSVGTTISQSLFLLVLSKIAPSVLEKIGVKQKK